MTRSGTVRLASALLLALVVLGCGSRRVVPAARVGTGEAPARRAEGPAPDRGSDYWEVQRAGANMFNLVPTRERYAAARDLGLDFARIAPNKWTSPSRDFLLGDADHLDGIPAADLEAVRAALDDAHAAGLGVVLTTLSLPGARWRQHNDDRADSRLWSDLDFHRQSALFWTELAGALRDHPALVAYNPLNEPYPEVTRAEGQSLQEWAAEVRGTAADVNVLYRAIVEAIREVDASTPIVLDAGSHASPEAFERLEPLDDERVLYSFHLYEPWEHTTWRRNRGETSYASDAWNGNHLRRAVEPVERWQRRHGLPSSRIVMGEFGCDRRVPGAAGYLEDAIELADGHGWHWAFYSFREDEWDGMDYELGSEPLPWPLREARGRGEAVTLPRGPNAIFQVLVDGVARLRERRGTHRP